MHVLIRKGGLMKKKVVYAGIIVLIAAIAVLLLSGGIAHSLLLNFTTTYNITVNSNSFSYEQFNITNTTRFFMIFEAKDGVNLYLFNSSAFGLWDRYMKANSLASGIKKAIGLEGSGAIAIFANTTVSTYPQIENKTQASIYSANSLLFVPGKYDVVIDNTNGSKSSSLNVSTILLVPEAGYVSGKISGSSSLTELAVLGLIMIVLFILALVLIIYGLISKPKSLAANLPPDKVSNEYIDELYSSVEKKKKGKNSN